jgi:hypothetical protein
MRASPSLAKRRFPRLWARLCEVGPQPLLMPASLMPRRGNRNPSVEKTEVQRCPRKSLRCLVKAFGRKSTSEGNLADGMKQGSSRHRSSLFSFTYSGSHQQMRPVFLGEGDEGGRVVFVARVHPRIVSARWIVHPLMIFPRNISIRISHGYGLGPAGKKRRRR